LHRGVPCLPRGRRRRSAGYSASSGRA
jgi:hypothetical protein